jgi:hypothetical protein
MERNQLELDFEPLKATEKKIEETKAAVFDFSKAKQKKIEREKQQLYETIVSSVNHYFDERKRK